MLSTFYTQIRQDEKAEKPRKVLFNSFQMNANDLKTENHLILINFSTDAVLTMSTINAQ